MLRLWSRVETPAPVVVAVAKAKEVQLASIEAKAIAIHGRVVDEIIGDGDWSIHDSR
jgi:hypothetical protein